MPGLAGKNQLPFVNHPLWHQEMEQETARTSLLDMNLLPFIHKFIDVQKKPVGLIASKHGSKRQRLEIQWGDDN